MLHLLTSRLQDQSLPNQRWEFWLADITDDVGGAAEFGAAALFGGAYLEGDKGTDFGGPERMNCRRGLPWPSYSVYTAAKATARMLDGSRRNPYA